jgi:hypothetical protein
VGLACGSSLSGILTKMTLLLFGIILLIKISKIIPHQNNVMTIKMPDGEELEDYEEHGKTIQRLLLLTMLCSQIF